MTDPNFAAEFLAEQRRLADAATPGPWESECDDGEGTIEVNAGSALTKWTDHGNGIRTGSPARSWQETDKIAERDDLYDDDFEQASVDAEFIAASRTSVPRMVKALEEVLMVHAASPEYPHGCDYCERKLPCATNRAITAALEGENE